MNPLWRSPLKLLASRGARAPDAACLASARVSAVHRSAGRLPEFQLLVALIESSQGHFVLRRAAGAGSEPQLRAIWDHGAALARDLDLHDALAACWSQPDACLLCDGANRTLILETMLAGPSDEARMVLALERGDLKAAIAVADRYRAGLEPWAAVNGAGPGTGGAALSTGALPATPASTRVLPAWTFDLMPQNVIRDGGGRGGVFDLEWAPLADLSLEFVQARAVLNLAGACEHLAGNFQDDAASTMKLWQWYLPEALCRALAPGENVLETWFPQVARHECDFQRRVQWQPPWYQAPDPSAMAASPAPPRRVPGRELFGWSRIRRRLNEIGS